MSKVKRRGGAGRGSRGSVSSVSGTQSGDAGNVSKDKGASHDCSFASLIPWQCLVCDEPCEEDRDSLECYNCRQWAHKTCAGLKDEVFKTLTTNTNLQWTCCPCTDGERKKMTGSEVKLDLLMSMIPMISKVSERLESMERGLGERKLEEKIEEVVERKLADALEEAKEKEKRKKNLIIVNLKESAKTEIAERKVEDLKEVKKLLSKVAEVGDDDISEPVRLGKVGGNKPRMLKVTIKTEEKKREILKKAPQLNTNTTQAKDRVFINPDLTNKEREQERQLRDEKRERERNGEKDLVIRGGRIVKRRIQLAAGDNTAKEQCE